MRASRNDSRRIPGQKGRNRKVGHDDDRIVTIAVDLASGRYEGPAKIIDRDKLEVEFIWHGRTHLCMITKAEIVKNG
jgi:hypothetical protein